MQKRKRMSLRFGNETTNKVTDALMKGLDEFNPIYMMANSGARGSYEPDQTAGRHARLDGGPVW